MESGERSPQGEDGGNCYEPFDLQPSVLEAVASVCPEHEAEEIWRAVGPSLVEQAKDLLDEARIHLEIWRELSDNADHVASRGLPEPPCVRERLIREIRFLANHLRTSSGSSTLGYCTADRNREILDYALTTPDLQRAGGGCGSGCGRPPSSISSRDGRETPLRLATPSSRDGSCSSVLSGVSVENVSLTAIDSTVQYLRESLEEEIVQRRLDIAFLQECNEGQSVFLQGCPPPPSLRELRDVGTLLEREVMSGTTRDPPLITPSPSTKVVQPSPPPQQCSTKSSACLRRASGIKPRPIQSSPAPVITRTDESPSVCSRAMLPRRLSTSAVVSPDTRYTTAITANSTPTCQPII